MTLLLVLLTAFLTLLLCFVTLVQTLYLESLRLRTRDLPALQQFKATLQQQIGLSVEQGALAFSLIKHLALPLLGVVVLLSTSWRTEHVWHGAAAALFLAPGLMFVSSYFIPQLLFRKTSLAWFSPVGVAAAKALALLISPLTWLLNFLYSLSELGAKDEEEGEEPGAAEHIDALISAGEEEGLIEKDDRKLIQSVVAFGDKTVREVMTPRPNIVAIDANKSLEALRELAIHERYTRIPVFDRNIDQIAGFVHVRDLFELDEEERSGKRVRDLMREVKLVPETKPVNDLLREMQDTGTHMAVVVDEYGNTAGLVTMEDMVEVIVGEIHDEHEPERDMEEETPGVYRVSGSFDVDRLYDLFGFRPGDDTESTTVGGLVTEWLGRVPHKGQTIERDGLRVEVLAGNERRVERLRITKIASAAPPVNGEPADEPPSEPAVPRFNGEKTNARK